MMKAGSCRWTDVTKLLHKQRRDSQCNGIGLCRILSTGILSIYRGTHRVENSAVSPRKFFFDSCVAIAVKNGKFDAPPPPEKIATRRLISRIILASVVNASSRRRRGLPGRRDRRVLSGALTARSASMLKQTGDADELLHQ